VLLRRPVRAPAAGHRPGRSHVLREEIGHGCDGIKPGWTRVNLNYFISPPTADYIAAAVELIAADSYRLLPAYRFDPRHRAARPARLDDGPTGLPADSEALRWFPLPPACLQGRSARTAGLG
jgi:hypothetical protein